MIEAGIKTEEYREFKPYWVTRLLEWYYSQNAHIIVQEHITLTEATDICADNIEALTMTHPRAYDAVCFSYGYTKRHMTFEYKGITIGRGSPEWGAPDRDVFIIKLGKKI